MKITKTIPGSTMATLAIRIAVCSMLLAAGGAYAQVAMEAGNITRNSTEAISQRNAAPINARVASPAGPSNATASERSQERSAAQNPTMAGLRCSRGTSLVSEQLELKTGKSTLLRMPNAVTYRTVGDPGVVQAILTPPDGLYLLGTQTGTTNMIVQDKTGTCHVIDVIVRADAGALQDTLKRLMPDEKEIHVIPAANAVVLTGVVEDATAVSRAVEIANAFMRKTPSSGGGRAFLNVDAQNAQPALQDQVINQLSIRAPQQVMLEVKVAEVSKNLLDKLGVRADLMKTSGSWTYSLLTDFLTGTASGLFGATKSNGNEVLLEAEKRDGLVKILAEPNVMAISGQEGSFNAGGKILIPVAQTNNSGIATITLEEKRFGVQMQFTPTVLAQGRINLKVFSEVSELSREGVGITAAGITGRSILPLITERRAATTVQLFDGQSFAIGGLIKNNSTANIRALPVLGEIPVLGALFRSTEFQEEKTELIFVITPRLVKPLAANYSLPTDKVSNPSRAELFLGGKLEGNKPKASPALIAPESEAPPVQGGTVHTAPGGFEMK